MSLLRVAGIDIGKAADPTAVALLADWRAERLYRIALGTDYQTVAKHISEISRQGYALWIDATGVGAPVIDQARQLGAVVQAVSITAGERIHRAGDGWTVPKRELVEGLQAAIGNRLSLALPSSEKETLFAEMTAFQVQHGKHAAKFAAAAGKHDDLVLALALGVFGSRLSHISRDAQTRAAALETARESRLN